MRHRRAIDSDGAVVRVLRVKMAKTDRWIDRAIREDAREAVAEYLKTRLDSHPWLFVSQSRRTKFHIPGPLTRSAAHLIVTVDPTAGCPSGPPPAFAVKAFTSDKTWSFRVGEPNSVYLVEVGSDLYLLAWEGPGVRAADEQQVMDDIRRAA